MEDDGYFTMEAAGQPAGPGRYVEVPAIDSVEVLPGLGIRPVVGDRTMVNFVSFAPRAEAPRHVHEEEQLAVVIEGELEIDLDGDVRTLGAGGVAVIPSWVPHAMRTHETPCRELDIFSPPRRALLKRLRDISSRATSSQPDLQEDRSGPDRPLRPADDR